MADAHPTHMKPASSVANLANLWEKKQVQPDPEAPSTSGGAKKKFEAVQQDKCLDCGKTSYPSESIRYDGQIWHKKCFKCLQCRGICTLNAVAMIDGKLFCKTCFKRMFKEKGNYAVFNAEAGSSRHAGGPPAQNESDSEVDVEVDPEISQTKSNLEKIKSSVLAAYDEVSEDEDSRNVSPKPPTATNANGPNVVNEADPVIESTQEEINRTMAEIEREKQELDAKRKLAGPPPVIKFSDNNIEHVYVPDDPSPSPVPDPEEEPEAKPASDAFPSKSPVIEKLASLHLEVEESHSSMIADDGFPDDLSGHDSESVAAKAGSDDGSLSSDFRIPSRKKSDRAKGWQKSAEEVARRLGVLPETSGQRSVLPGGVSLPVSHKRTSSRSREEIASSTNSSQAAKRKMKRMATPRFLSAGKRDNLLLELDEAVDYDDDVVSDSEDNDSGEDDGSEEESIPDSLMAEIDAVALPVVADIPSYHYEEPYERTAPSSIPSTHPLAPDTTHPLAASILHKSPSREFEPVPVEPNDEEEKKPDIRRVRSRENSNAGSSAKRTTSTGKRISRPKDTKATNASVRKARVKARRRKSIDISASKKRSSSTRSSTSRSSSSRSLRKSNSGTIDARSLSRSGSKSRKTQNTKLKPKAKPKTVLPSPTTSSSRRFHSPSKRSQSTDKSPGVTLRKVHPSKSPGRLRPKSQSADQSPGTNLRKSRPSKSPGRIIPAASFVRVDPAKAKRGSTPRKKRSGTNADNQAMQLKKIIHRKTRSRSTQLDKKQVQSVLSPAFARKQEFESKEAPRQVHPPKSPRISKATKRRRAGVALVKQLIDMGIDKTYAMQAASQVDPLLPSAAQLCFHWMEENPADKVTLNDEQQNKLITLLQDFSLGVTSP